MMISHKNLRKIAEIMRIFLENFLKICPKKMYTLNRYGGNNSKAENFVSADRVHRGSGTSRENSACKAACCCASFCTRAY